MVQSENNHLLPQKIISLLEGDYVDKFWPYHELMKFRVHTILVVASLYDDFVMEADQTYSEQLTEEYSRLNISTPPPRIVRVSNTKAAKKKLEEQKFEIVILTSRVGQNPFDFGEEIKKKCPDMSVVLLLTSMADMAGLPPENQRSGVDHIFVYTGDSDIFLTIIKQVEDLKNLDRDTQLGKVRIILMIEDTITYYSLFLPMIYNLMVQQTRRLIAKSVNHLHRQLLVRGRPKIILAKTYEEAMFYIENYRDYIFTIISDIGFPRNGKKDQQAGFTLLSQIKEKFPFLPVLLQSSDEGNREKALEKGASFVYKHSPRLLADLAGYFEKIGFGDFVFRMPDGTEVGRARNISEFQKVIKKVPVESILYHGSKNDFSRWLYTRSESDLASELEKKKVSDFKDAEEIREYLIKFFARTRIEKKRGVISEFDPEEFFNTPFSRIGNGSLGGKGRGLAFVSSVLERIQDYLGKKYPNIQIAVPATVVIATDMFDKFLAENDLKDFVLDETHSDEEIVQRIISKNLPKSLKKAIREYAKHAKYPIAVRSSSLLEDSQFQPFAGIYETLLLPNTSRKYKQRAEEIEKAVKIVYASMFRQTARSYIQTVGQKIEVEKMAVILQQIVGRKHENRVYPSLSGVAQSYNYYPVSPAKAEDGIVHLAVGLGPSVTAGRKYLSFSPKFPKRLVQHYSPEASLKNSQSDFYALVLGDTFDLTEGELATLKLFDLETAELDGELEWSASTVDFQNNRILDGLRDGGPRVVTFPFLLKYERFPFSQLIQELLLLWKTAFGTEVEMEFSMNLDYENKRHELYILQVRPLITEISPVDVNIETYESTDYVLYSNMALGNGFLKDIHDIVVVPPEIFNQTETVEIKEEISKLNAKLKSEGKKYILIGPGRWGTSDPFLGIPVRWEDIDFADLIVEYGLERFQIDPSHGSHFFLNITSARKGYFSIPYGSKGRIDWDWIKQMRLEEESQHVRHYRCEKPLNVVIDGKKGKGIVLKPEIELREEQIEVYAGS
ncbi:MAG: hypothetical protein D6732_10895 [Methanobacteriota archaeon]|nr:MAG: hypothetical protein D6732_10895 [Euryarchaeota archaeon]